MKTVFTDLFIKPNTVTLLFTDLNACYYRNYKSNWNLSNNKTILLCLIEHT